MARRRWIVPSAATVDGRGDTYMSLIGKLVAAIVLTLWGASLILAGALGIKPGTGGAMLAVGSGVILILLALDQAWRVLRKLS
ncbi:MAG: hypothetical protein ACM31K_07615 [Solirubrobacterales bacterium]